MAAHLQAPAPSQLAAQLRRGRARPAPARQQGRPHPPCLSSGPGLAQESSRCHAGGASSAARSRHCRQLWRSRGPGHGRAKRERPCALPAHKRAGTLPCCAESSCARSASDYAARAAKARTVVRCSAGDRRTWTDLSSGGVWRRKMTMGAIWSFHCPFSLPNCEN